MIVYFTEQEIAQQDAIEKKFQKLITDAKKDVERLAPPDCPDTEIFFAGIDYDKDPEKWEAAEKRENEAIGKWIDSGGPEWEQAKEHLHSLYDELNDEREKLFRQCERRQFSELNGNTVSIISDFKKQVDELIKSFYESEKREQDRIAKGGWRQSIFSVALGGDKWKLYPSEIEKRIKRALYLHYEAVAGNKDITKSFDDFITDALQSSSYVDHADNKPFGKIYKTNTHRTRSQAGDINRKIPENLAITTFQNYQHSMSLYQTGNAYLQPLTSTDGLKFQKGKIYFDTGEQMRVVSEMELQNMKTKEGIENIDLALLRVFYSIILSAFENTDCKELKPIITLYIPDLAEYLGLQRNLNRQDVARVIGKTQQYHNIVGVLHGTRNNKPSTSLYPVLNFEGYDDKKNTISFSSPYMNHVIQTVYNLAIRKDKSGNKKLKANGDPVRLVSHSYLVKSEISKERNKAAVENVIIITTLIEQAGDNVPRIKASTIIERNPQLQQRLKNSQNPRQFLKRVFEKTWELLGTKTRLKEVYKNIVLPDPKDPAYIPTLSNLETIVFSFPHDGKK